MFEVMEKVAKFSCDYVKYGGSSCSGFLQVLMTAARTVGGLVYQETIEEMERELAKATEDFDRAVDVKALRVAKKTGMNSLFDDNSF